jgi:hypothetical protein
MPDPMTLVRALMYELSDVTCRCTGCMADNLASPDAHEASCTYVRTLRMISAIHGITMDEFAKVAKGARE